MGPSLSSFQSASRVSLSEEDHSSTRLSPTRSRSRSRSISRKSRTRRQSRQSRAAVSRVRRRSPGTSRVAGVSRAGGSRATRARTAFTDSKAQSVTFGLSPSPQTTDSDPTIQARKRSVRSRIRSRVRKRRAKVGPSDGGGGGNVEKEEMLGDGVGDGVDWNSYGELDTLVSSVPAIGIRERPSLLSPSSARTISRARRTSAAGSSGSRSRGSGGRKSQDLSHGRGQGSRSGSGSRSRRSTFSG